MVRGDAEEVLSRIPAGSFQAAVTSPPYFQQRDYGEGAGGLGLERTSEEYVAGLVRVFREVRRVLAEDGVLWLNLGDTSNAYNGGRGPSRGRASRGQHLVMPALPTGYGLTDPRFPNKSLLGVPWRVAAALAADSWTLRSAVVWRKTTPRPERVRDRPRRSYEMLFLLTRGARYRADYGDLTDVWDIPPGQTQAGGHPAAFPDELVRRCLEGGTAPGDAVLDPFCGSGTTVRVAAAMGRRALGVDRVAWWDPRRTSPTNT